MLLHDALCPCGRVGEDAASFSDALIRLDRFTCCSSLGFVGIAGAKRDLNLAMADYVAKSLRHDATEAVDARSSVEQREPCPHGDCTPLVYQRSEVNRRERSIGTWSYEEKRGEWRARRESNPRPSASKADALSN